MTENFPKPQAGYSRLYYVNNDVITAARALRDAMRSSHVFPSNVHSSYVGLDVALKAYDELGGVPHD